MSDLFIDVLCEIEENIQVIDRRFARIKKSEDFIANEDGNILLDAIAMRLMTIGENVKKLSRLDSSILNRYNEINWEDVMRFRDFIAHHYEMLDFEVVFSICKRDLPILDRNIQQMLKDIT